MDDRHHHVHCALQAAAGTPAVAAAAGAGKASGAPLPLLGPTATAGVRSKKSPYVVKVARTHKVMEARMQLPVCQMEQEVLL